MSWKDKYITRVKEVDDFVSAAIAANCPCVSVQTVCDFQKLHVSFRMRGRAVAGMAYFFEPSKITAFHANPTLRKSEKDIDAIMLKAAVCLARIANKQTLAIIPSTKADKGFLCKCGAMSAYGGHIFYLNNSWGLFNLGKVIGVIPRPEKGNFEKFNAKKPKELLV